MLEIQKLQLIVSNRLTITISSLNQDKSIKNHIFCSWISVDWRLKKIKREKGF